MYDNTVQPPILKQQVEYDQIRGVDVAFFECCSPDKNDLKLLEGWIYKFTLAVRDREYQLTAETSKDRTMWLHTFFWILS